MFFRVGFALILDTLRSLTKWRWPPAAILILLKFHLNTTSDAKYLKLCTGMTNCKISRSAKWRSTIFVILLSILNRNFWHVMNEWICVLPNDLRPCYVQHTNMTCSLLFIHLIKIHVKLRPIQTILQIHYEWICVICSVLSREMICAGPSCLSTNIRSQNAKNTKIMNNVCMKI
jgi:hypothetical protein